MPRTGPRRGLVAFKAHQGEADEFDRRALEEGFVKRDGEPNRSDMIRLMLDYARRHMPPGWRPESTGGQ